MGSVTTDEFIIAVELLTAPGLRSQVLGGPVGERPTSCSLPGLYLMLA